MAKAPAAKVASASRAKRRRAGNPRQQVFMAVVIIGDLVVLWLIGVPSAAGHRTKARLKI